MTVAEIAANILFGVQAATSILAAVMPGETVLAIRTSVTIRRTTFAARAINSIDEIVVVHYPSSLITLSFFMPFNSYSAI